MAEKRLIDANALGRDAFHIKQFGEGIRCVVDWDDVEAAPTVDAVEVVHGYNTGKARWFQCSVCGYGFDDVYLLDESPEYMEPNYCAHCGEKMDGDGNA